MTEPNNEPSNSADDNPGNGRSSNGRRRQRVAIPSVDEILQQLIQLNGAVTIGAMSTKEASLIHKNLRTVLDVQLKRANREETGPSQEALAELCRDDPRVLNVIEPFVTSSQLQWLMTGVIDGQEVTDDPDESV